MNTEMTGTIHITISAIAEQVFESSKTHIESKHNEYQLP
jgi:hypothetical protein